MQCLWNEAGAARWKANRRPRLPVGPELLQHDFHLGVRQQHRPADLPRPPVLLAQRFELDGEVDRLAQVAAEDQQAVVGEQAGAAAFERGQRGV
jgi:hypothetical protein